jgi:hypothetical protein
MPKTAPVAHVDAGDTHVEAGVSADVEVMYLLIVSTSFTCSFPGMTLLSPRLVFAR